MENYNVKMEQNLLEMVKQKEDADKRLLSMEVLIGVLVTAVFLSLVLVAGFVPMENWLRVLLILVGFAIFMICMSYALKIEQVAGYYECAKCGHRHVPQYSSVFFAMHMGRTRYMSCPKCGKMSWQKKVLSKE